MTDRDAVIFVVDDDEHFRSSLSRALRMRGYTVLAYSSAQEFLEAYDGSVVGCLVLDYGMPGMSGLDLQAHINGAGIPLPIIFVTGHGGIPESVQAMKGGAVDFLEKPFRQSILVERIETARKMALEMAEAAGRQKDVASRFDRLTAREQEIVDLIVEHPGEVTSKEIGRALGISPRTVDHHRARILEKLQIRSVVELVDLAKDPARTR